VLATPAAGVQVAPPPRAETNPHAATVQLGGPPHPPPHAPPHAPPEPAAPPLLQAAPRSPSLRRRVITIGGGLLVVAGVSLAVVAATRGGPTAAPAGSAPATANVAPPNAAPAPPSGDAVADLVAQAGELAVAGRREAAIDVLSKARRTYPADARLPYHAGMLYLDKMWWADGLKQLRAAIALDPAYKADPALIKAVLFGFNTTKQYDWTLAGFLRKDIGAGAKPYLQDTAENHPNKLIRKRAAGELRRYR
jgi:hypothetical protein